MPLSFTCPNCAAPLDVNVIGATTQRCPYCNTSVIVPEELREVKSQTIASFVSSPSHKVPPTGNLSQILESILEKAIAGEDIEANKLLRTNFAIGLKERLKRECRTESVPLLQVQQAYFNHSLI